jgi:hypothetical protein
MDTVEGVDCENGGSVPNAVSVHRTWDPNTLAGRLQTTHKVEVCGNPVGYHETHTMQLKQAP